MADSPLSRILTVAHVLPASADRTVQKIFLWLSGPGGGGGGGKGGGKGVFTRNDILQVFWQRTLDQGRFSFDAKKPASTKHISTLRPALGRGSGWKEARREKTGCA